MANEKKVVAVAGSTGRAGKCIVEELLHRKYKVRALIIPPFDESRPPHLMHEDIELRETDLQSVPSLQHALRGAQYLISAIGSQKPFSKKENDRIDNIGNRNLAQACVEEGLEQLVVISSIGVGDSYKAISLMSKIFMGSILKAKEKSEEFIRQCGITYTIIRPGGYANKDLPGRTVFGEGGYFSGRITRKQVAVVCVDAIENSAMKNSVLEVVDSSTLDDEHQKFVITMST